MRLQPEIFERNISALRVFQPEVAEILRSCTVPDGVSPTLGRDGEPTFLLPGPEGPTWLGGSSMPRVSAEEMLGNAVLEHGSVTLPAMLTGMEAIVLARRLPSRFAVFVTDHELAIKLPLMIRDYETPLANGKVVFLLSDDLSARAKQFFSAHPGFLASAHVFQVPQLDPGRLANVTRALEDAATVAVRTQQEQLGNQVANVCAADSRTRNMATRRVALLAAFDSSWLEETAERYVRTLRELGVACEACVALTPDKCHHVARVGAVAEIDADLALYLGGAPAPEREMFPEALPIADWLTHGQSRIPRPPRGPFDFLVVENRSALQAAVASGWPDRRTLVLEPSADCAESLPVQIESVRNASPVRIFMSLPDDRPEAVGITLPSQLELWRALQKEVLRRADNYSPAIAPEVLRVAQSSSGTTFDDAPLIEAFEGWLLTRIAPSTIARCMAQSLVKSGFHPEIRGSHWPAIGRGEDLRRGPMPSGRQLSALLNEVSWVVVPWFSHGGVALAMEAMARGNVVLMRGSRNDFVAEYPGLADVSDSIHWFLSAGTMNALLRTASAKPDRAAEKARVTARLIREKHSLAARLRVVINAVDTARNGEPGG